MRFKNLADFDRIVASGGMREHEVVAEIDRTTRPRDEMIDGAAASNPAGWS